MKRRLITAASILGLLACCTLSRSCANTTTPPGGGPKDTIPPVLLKLTPSNNTVNFPVVDGTIALMYDEYTVIKNSNDIFFSPPSRKRPKTKIKGKNIIVSFQDTLLKDKTYTIDFGQALADNNEGNVAPRLVYTFSTGAYIDSLYLTGKITDSKTLQPVKGALVAIFSDLSDSACFNSMPDAAVKSDDWGFFSIRNIRDTSYRIYAYTDADNDYKYNPDDDQVAFLDTIIRPVDVVNDTIYELNSFNMKDTAACAARNAMVSMQMFKELQTVQYLQNSGRSSDKIGYLKFSASDVKITQLDFVGVDRESVILQYNKTRDSIDFWINSDYRIGDSLLINLTYLKTDSLGSLSEYSQRLSLAVDKQDSKAIDNKAKGRNSDPDSVFTLMTKVSDETVEQEGVEISSELPIIQVIRDSIHLYETNPKGQTVEKAFTISQDSLEIRKYIFKPADPMVKGYDYEMKIGIGGFRNLDKKVSKSVSASFKIPQSEELSTLILNFSGVSGSYIVELTDEKMDKAVRTFIINSDTALTIPYLKAGSYAIRVSEDTNGNGWIDTGNLLKKKQPERVRFYESTPDKRLLEIPDSSEIEQFIDIQNIFE